MPAVHQFLPVLSQGDACSGHALQAQRILREMGVDSDLFVEHAHPPMEGLARSYRDYAERARSGDVLLYHLAVGSVLADALQERPERLVVDYHNLTPVEYFELWDPSHTWAVTWGRRQLADLAGRSEAALADSRYNEADLVDLGYRNTTVVPILLDTAAFDHEVDASAEARLLERKEAGGGDWLFVGRIAPNKAQHDIVKAFAVYRRVYDPQARLWLVGGSAGGAYSQALERLISSLRLRRAVTVTGAVSPGVLSAHFRTADVFVCLSEHEGFCVPLLEAMHHRLPIVAHAAAAVPGTLGDGGLLLDDKAPTTVAAAAHLVLDDPARRAALGTAGARRLEDFSLDRTAAMFRDAIAPLVGV